MTDRPDTLGPDGDHDLELSFFARVTQLADALVGGIDVVDLADHLVRGCLEIDTVRDVGILLDDQRGHLRMLAASSEESRVLELLELQNAEGPCLDAFRTGELVEGAHLAEHGERWPLFREAALEQGVQSVYAFPMRLREQTIGALNVFTDDAAGLPPRALEVLRAMATMSTLGILSHWTIRRHELLAEQLQSALESRIVIEQAKGVIAERLGLDMGAAFSRLRTAARSSRRTLAEVAEDVATGRLAADALTASGRSSGGPPRG